MNVLTPLAVVVLLTGCAASPHQARSASTAGPATTSAPATQPAHLGMPLTIRALWPQPNSTVRYARQLTISLPGGKPVVLTSDVAAGRLAPIIDEQLPLTDDRYLLLGWSSLGDGTQTLHAILMSAAGGELKVADHLAFQTDRGSACLVLRRDLRTPAIGIFQPGRRVREAADWSLSVGARRLDLAALRAIRYDPPVDTSNQDLYFLYGPPMSTMLENPQTRRIAWFRIDGEQFH